jgi:3-oxoacyl-[acyl-carrier-protein] synthase-3
MNNKNNKILTSVQYVLGDKCLNYQEAHGYAETELPALPDLWGWGDYFQSTKDINEFEIEAAEMALEEAQLERADITAVVFCNTASSNGCEEKSDNKKAVLDSLGLKNAYPITIQTNGCDSLLMGINIATGLLSSGESGAILVVAADKTLPISERFKRYGIFSDSSCACIVTTHQVHGYDILNSRFVSEVETMYEEASFTTDLAIEINNSLLSANGYSMSDVSMVFTNNLFKPISQLKEVEAGADKNKIYQKNISRIGHCYSNDSLINLSDYAKDTVDIGGQLFLLFADSPGLRTGLLIKAQD